MAKRRALKILAVAAAVLLGLIAVAHGWYLYHFPYGSSHCCDQILYSCLRDYATKHDGAFPAGEVCPEASLTLLMDGSGADANLLRGKSVPEAVVQQVLDRGELLGPETCGWNYVEGLRLDDDPKLALFWDKAGLDHIGGRLSGGGHIVMCVDGWRKYISAADWPAFVAEQRELLAKRRPPERDK